MDLLEDMLARALDEAMPWERDVIARRFGLAGPRQTLKEIGAAYGTTRERVRQIEAKALRGLKQRYVSELMAIIGKDAGEVWRRLAGRHEIVAGSRVARAAKALPPVFLLALALCGLTVPEWLDLYARACDGGWAPPPVRPAPRSPMRMITGPSRRRAASPIRTCRERRVPSR